MIVVRVIGGLGNQMFQYALGRKLALKHKTELKLDITGFETYTLHKYCLDKLNVQATVATREEIGKLKEARETSPTFDPAVLETGDDMYFVGHWTSEKYFSDIGKLICAELVPRNVPQGKDAEVLEKILETDSVSIHVRRGDYVNNRVYGVCGLDYYEKAIKYILRKVKRPTFFVFSDDHAWVKENLKINSPVEYVQHNGPDKNFEDIRLMSACKHNIIANSTFSWWGAWLNENPDKIVIAPRKWFWLNAKDARGLWSRLKEKMKSDMVKCINIRQWFGKGVYTTNDLIPDSWLKI